MAAAGRPNPADRLRRGDDTRVACPLCAGLIHPIAGRCKHCKGDLTAIRAVRPAAAAALPALAAGAPTPSPAPSSPHANGHAGNASGNGANGQINGHVHGHYHPPVAIGAPAARTADPHAMQTILPPRPTGRMYAAEAAGPSWWRSWPLIVIVLAGLAIVAALVLMVWPPANKATDEPTKANKLGPGPERMDTNPLPPSQPNPNNQPHSGVDPWAKPGPAPSPPIDIPDNPDPGDPDPIDPDPIDPDPDPSVGQFGGLSGSGAVVMAMMRHACDRASSCGRLDDTLRDYCAMARRVPSAPSPPTCPAANRCFEKIDRMSCTAGFGDISQLSSVMYRFQDCVEAISC